MATTIIRGVAAAGKCRNHGISNCTCHRHLSSSSKSILLQSSSLSPITEEKRDTPEYIEKHIADSSTSCACLVCARYTPTISSEENNESFQTANISTSTSYAAATESTAVSSSSEPIEYTELQAPVTALGQLKEKQSPLKCLSKNLPDNSISLRSKTPFYAQQILTPEKFLATQTIPRRQFIDQSAVDIVKDTNKMFTKNGRNSQRRIALGSGLNGRYNKNETDINRNNGFIRNGTIMTSANAEKREHLYKILVIGELGTGKTSFIKRYVHQFFSQNYRATIGVDFALKVLHWDQNTIVRLQLWDIAGQERFGNMTRVYYKEAVGAFIVFDVTRSGTFDCVNKWKEDLDSKVQLPDGSPIPCILLANKCDQDKQGIVTTPEKIEEYVRDNGFAGWFETSAKENINIDEAARALVNKILLNDKLISASDLADSERFNLNNTGDQTSNESRSKCSC